MAMITRTIISLSLLALALFVAPFDSSSVPSELVLKVTRSSDAKTVLASITPTGSLNGCTLTLFGSGSKAKLESTPQTGRRIKRFSSISGSALVTARELKVIRRTAALGRTVDAYLLARANCSGGKTDSAVARIALRTATNGAAPSLSAWFSDLGKKVKADSIKLQVAFSNLSFSGLVDLKNPGDGTNRLFLAQQDGKIYVFENSSTTSTKTLFLDIGDKVASSSEQGLLGMAFHPNYESNGYFYVNYTRTSDGATVVARYSVDGGNANAADAGSELIILTVSQPYSNHNGGNLAFGPDGYLYIGLGDGGSGGDPDEYGQNKTSLLGKMLRINVDATANSNNYAIPSDNPFVGNTSGFKEEIFATGFRNPWRYSFDSVTGKLWAADVGQSAREEIDIVEVGKNYGWNTMEGNLCFDPSSGCDKTGLTLPILDYPRSEGQSVTGGYVYRGSSNPNLVGLYIFGDFISGRIWAVNYDSSGAQRIQLVKSDLAISAFGVDQANELYILSYSDGKIYKLFE